jgi:uncharacterized phage protein gp47/JayE
MSDKYLEFEEFLALAEASLKTEFPQLNPAVTGNWATAFAKAICSAGIAVQSQVQDLERELFPLTATGDYLDRWGTYEGLARNLPTKASGPLYQRAEPIPVPPDPILVPAGSVYYAESNDRTYVTNSDTYVTNHVGDILTATAYPAGDIDTATSAPFTHVGNISTASNDETTTTIVTEEPHLLSVGLSVTIAGVVTTPPGKFDGTFTISAILSDTSFQYLQSLTPGPGGTGGTFSTEFTRVDIVTVSDHGLTSGETVTIADVVSTPVDAFNGVFDITSILSDTSFRYEIYGPQTALSGTDGTYTALLATVDVVVSSPHDLIIGSIVTIAGVVSDPADAFNGDYQVIYVISETAFQYQKTTLPSAPSGTGGTYTAFFARVDVQAEEVGADGNLSPDTELSLVDSPDPKLIAANVINSGLHGGLDEETDSDYRARILQSRSEIEGVFTIEQIRRSALTVVGNTRAFVVTPNDVTQPAQPLPGQVEVYVFRDDDPSPIPNAAILAQTKENIIAFGKLPANTSVDDLFVFAPTLVIVDFVFDSISPSTPGMRSAIEAQIKAFFIDSAEFATNVPENSYLAAIQNTQDLITGDFLKTFSLTAPVGDIVVGVGEIAYCGTVTFT